MPLTAAHQMCVYVSGISSLAILREQHNTTKPLHVAERFSFYGEGVFSIMLFDRQLLLLSQLSLDSLSKCGYDLIKITNHTVVSYIKDGC